MELYLPLWLSIPLAAFLWIAAAVLFLTLGRSWIDLRQSWLGRLLTDEQRAGYLAYCTVMTESYAMHEELTKVKEEQD